MGSPWQPGCVRARAQVAVPRLEGSGAKTGWAAHQRRLEGVWSWGQPTVCEQGGEVAMILLSCACSTLGSVRRPCGAAQEGQKTRAQKGPPERHLEPTHLFTRRSYIWDHLAN